jgi:ubiquinone/menaquinone biosynthesis C-methylase UbiE
MRIGRLARWYRWIEYAAFGHALERRRFAFLPRLSSARRILVLGEGDGRTTVRLLEVAQQATIDVVELSPEMIALAKYRTKSFRVSFRCADALLETWPAQHYDAIVTSFFLDCLNTAEVRDLVCRLRNTLTAEGTWLIAEFAMPPDGWKRLHARVWLAIMYRFFGVTTGLRTRRLPEIEAAMRECGLIRVERETERAGLMISEVWRPGQPRQLR